MREVKQTVGDLINLLYQVAYLQDVGIEAALVMTHAGPRVLYVRYKQNEIIYEHRFAIGGSFVYTEYTAEGFSEAVAAMCREHAEVKA